MPLDVKKENFIKATKLVLKKTQSRSKETRENQKKAIIEAFNTLVLYIKTIYTDCEIEQKRRLTQELDFARNKLTLCLYKFKIDFELTSDKFELIELEDLILDSLDCSDSDNNMSDNKDFLRLCAQTIPHIFKGDPLELQSFLNSVDLLNSLALETQHVFLLTFLKTKISGKAIESINDEVTTIASFKKALKNAIKPDNSKVVEGRMAALRADRKSAQEFAKDAELLAEALERSLVFEGFPPNKAKQITIEKTVEVCRASTSKEIVKAVLASTSFHSPSEVLSKFTIETGKEVAEKQILSFRSYRNNSKYNKNGKFNKYRGQNYNRPQNRNFNQGNRYNYNNNNKNNNKRQFNNKSVRVTNSENLATPQNQLGAQHEM